MPYTRSVPDDLPRSTEGEARPPLPVGPVFRGGVERVGPSTEGAPDTPAAPTGPPDRRDADTASRPDAANGPTSAPGPARPVSEPTAAPTGPFIPSRTDGPATGSAPAAPASASPASPTALATPPVASPVIDAPPAAAPVHTVAPARSGKVRARKVRRIVRHVEPWSVLKISVLFYAALFLIVCVASAILWGAARASGTIDNAESFITSVGGFGNCEPINGAAPASTTTLPGAISTAPVDQLDPAASPTSVPDPGAPGAASPGDKNNCRAGERLVGEFKFEDVRIFEAFALGGIVLVLAGSAANVVMVLLFNLMSDLTGGVRVTVLEEDTPARGRSASGSPAARPRD